MSSMIGIERIGFPTLPPPLEYDTMGVCGFLFFLSICIAHAEFAFPKLKKTECN